MAFITVTGTVCEKRYLTDDVLFFSLSVPWEFTFKAGQFVSIKVVRGGEWKLKSYSIFSPPSLRGQLDFCAKIIPNGFASEVFKIMKKGDSFTLKGPLGHFGFDEVTDEHWFIGTGTGIAPLYSIIQEYARKYPDKKFRLIHGVRKRANLIYFEELMQLQREIPNFTFIPTLSQEEWSGHTGRVQTCLEHEDLSNKTFYVCGLAEMVLEVKELLLSKSVAPERMKVERFD